MKGSRILWPSLSSWWDLQEKFSPSTGCHTYLHSESPFPSFQAPTNTVFESTMFHFSHTHVVADRGVSWEEAVEMASRTTTGQGSGFYHSKREQYHHYLHLLAIQKENAPLLFNIIR